MDVSVLLDAVCITDNCKFPWIRAQHILFLDLLSQFSLIHCYIATADSRNHPRGQLYGV